MFPTLNTGLRLFGARVQVDGVWILLLVAVFWLNPQYGWFVLAFYGVVILLHEVGHLLAGRAVGLQSGNILLTAFGGVVDIQGIRTPWQELVMTAGGPAVNVVLCLPLWLLADLSPFCARLFVVNLIILAFNLIPAFPMDGGRILRALLWRWWHDRSRATRWAASVSKVTCAAMAGLGLYIGQLWLLIMAFYVWTILQAEMANEQASDHPVERPEDEAFAILRRHTHR